MTCGRNTIPVFRTEPKMLWDCITDQSQINLFRANGVILSVTKKNANEVALGTSVVSRVRLRGLVVPSPEHRMRVAHSRTIVLECGD